MKKKLVGMHALTYTEHLKLRGLEISRDELGRIYYLPTNLFGLTALHSDDFFILSESPCTRGHPYKLFLPRCSTDVSKYFFSARIIKVWNELPTDTDFSSIDLCKRALDGFNFTAYCDI